MLSLPTIQNYMKLKLGPAIKLAHLVEKLKQISAASAGEASATAAIDNEELADALGN